MALPPRFWKKVKKLPNGCWQWTAGKIKNGYAQYRVGDKSVYAHRVAFEALRQRIPAGMQLDHLCRNRACVNPDHLEIVNNRTNCLRGHGPTAINARKTKCKRGHPLAGDNLYLYRDGRRDCRTCMKARAKAYYRAHRPRLLKAAHDWYHRRVGHIP